MWANNRAEVRAALLPTEGVPRQTSAQVMSHPPSSAAHANPNPRMIGRRVFSVIPERRGPEPAGEAGSRIPDSE